MKQLQNKKYFLILLLLLVFTISHMFVISQIISAEKLSLQEALEIGLKYNSDLQTAREKITQAKRALAEIMAQRDWQVELNTDYLFQYSDGEFNSTDEIGINTNISKIISSGYKLEIQPVSNVSSNITISDTELISDFNISLSKKILPLIPTEIEQNYYKAEKELLKAEKNLAQEKANKIIIWIEEFLNLCHLKENINIYRENLEKAEANLQQVLKEKEIGEAGEAELLTAQLSVKEARYQLQESQNQLEYAESTLADKLGLKSTEVASLKFNSASLNKYREKTTALIENYMQNENLLEIAAANSIDIFANLLERDVLQKELDWLKKENNFNVDLVSDYNTASDEISISFAASYKLFDGGQHDLQLDTKKAEIDNNKHSFTALHNNLKQKIKQYVNNIQLAEMDLEKGELKYKRSKNQLMTAEKQLEMGLIDYLEYQEEWIGEAEAEINIQSLRDQLFLARLKFLQIINFTLLEEIFEGVKI